MHRFWRGLTLAFACCFFLASLHVCAETAAAGVAAPPAVDSVGKSPEQKQSDAGKSNPANSPAPAVEAQAKTSAAKPGPLFMWKVTGPKGSAYLVGSIHLVKPDFYPLPKEMEDAFKQSSVLVLEIDESKQDPVQLQQMMLASGMYLNGDNLQNHVSQDTGNALKKYLETNTQAGAFLMMRPWLAAMMIPMMELQHRGFDPAVGIDKHFLNEAKQSGKAVDEVESADFQMKLISGFSEDLQDKLLLSALLDVQDTDKDAAAMTEAWKKGNDQGMEQIVSKDEVQHPELKPVMEKLLYERNLNMAKKLEELLKTDKSYFIVVGAAHLVGNRGLLHLLKEKNYKVEQISSLPQAPPAKENKD